MPAIARSGASLGAARLLAFALPALLLGGAYVSQYVFGLAPCEMCWWQRYPHFAAVAFALLSYVARPVKLWVLFAGLAIVVSGLIGGMHAGVEYGWWQGPTACTASLFDSGADPLEAVLSAPLIRCDTAPWSLFDISLAGWNFLNSVTGGIAVLWFALREGKRA